MKINQEENNQAMSKSFPYLRTFSTIFGSVLALAAVCTLLAAYESMSRALRRATETNESIYVQLYPRGFLAALDSVQVPVVEDILLFSQPEMRFENPQVFLAPPPRFSYTQTLTIQDLPAISHVGWRDASQTGGTITTTAGVYYVRPVSQYWLELYGARIAKGRFFSAQDSLGRVVILGSQARQGLFGDGAVLGKEIASADVRDKYPCQVVGVLEPFGSAYGPLAAGYDQFIFLLDTLLSANCG